MSNSLNISRIKMVYDALGDLRDSVVFVGGATVSLYADRYAFEARPTKDVDVVVEIYTRLEFSMLEERLRQKGFKNDIDAGFLGRYKLDTLTVDIMPLTEKVLGFNNRWYKDGFQSAIEYELDKAHVVKIFTAPYFLASKLEAFKNRGKNKSGEYDGRQSEDFEDIVYLLDNRHSLWEEIDQSPSDLQQYLRDEFTKLLNDPYFEEWIDVHVTSYSPPGTYYILERIQNWLSASEKI